MPARRVSAAAAPGLLLHADSSPGEARDSAGTFRFKHKLPFIANALKHYHIGLEEIDDGIRSIYFNRVLLARLDERDHVIRG